MSKRNSKTTIRPKTLDDAYSLVSKILIQGDMRYYDVDAEFELASFLLKHGVFLERRVLPVLKEPSLKDLQRHAVQGPEKYVALMLLQSSGIKNKDIFFERHFYGSIPDVYARNDKSVILVECCSCRISKIIEYLSAPETQEIWIITEGIGSWEPSGDAIFQKMQWFVFTRGKMWNTMLSKFNNTKRKRLREIHRRVFNNE